MMRAFTALSMKAGKVTLLLSFHTGLTLISGKALKLCLQLRLQVEIKRILEEYTEKAMRRDAAPSTGRYSVV